MGGRLKRISLVVLVMAAALAVAAPATAAGREATVDRPTGQPQARAAGFFIPVVAALAVRAAAPVAARAGAGIVAGVVGRASPQLGRARTARSIMDARTVNARKIRDGVGRTTRWLRKKWPKMKGYSVACLGGAALENKSIFINAFGELEWPSFDTHLRRTAAACGLGMAGLWTKRFVFDRKPR
jgi:hypothetical protein